MAGDADATLEELADRYYAAGDATRKASSYFQSYARLLAPRRAEPLRILELGVSSGASLLIWRDFLPNATVVGVDIAEPPGCVQGQSRIHVLRGAQDDPMVLDRAAALAGGPFDMIIDDASHLGYITKRSLGYLFPRHLCPGGCYVIEDFGTGFLPEYPDGQAFEPPDWHDATAGATEFRSSQFGMVGVVKQLIDELMQELMTGHRPYIAVERIIFETNIAFIEKSYKPNGPLPLPRADRRSPSRDVMPAADTLQRLMDSMQQQDGRLVQLEQSVAGLRRGLAPLIRLRRLLRRLCDRSSGRGC